MRKTSVYLSDSEAESLRRASAVSGKAQSELIREGVRLVVGQVAEPERIFRSLGAGHGGGEPYRRWTPDDVYRKIMGEQ